MAGQSWIALIAALDGLPGLSTAEKGKARVLLLRKSQEEASLLVSGLPDVAAEAIKEILRQEDAAAGLGTTRAGSATPNADAQPPITMAAPKEVLEATTKQALEGQAATLNETLKEVLEGQAATTKQALEGQAATVKETLKEVLEGQAATTKQALEGQAATLNETLKEVLEEQAATTKQALEALKEALTDNRATWPFPVSTVDWNQLEQSWAAYLTEVPIKKKMS